MDQAQQKYRQTEKGKYSARKRAKAYRKRDPNKFADRHLQRKFGLGLTDYNNMLQSQNGVCAICFNPPTYRRLDVDHDHITGAIRGLLCSWCNKQIVAQRNTIEILESAIKYLKKYSVNDSR